MLLVKKTMDILEVFLNGKKEISVTDLAKITGYNVATVHGILNELAKSGYVQQMEKRGKYSLGLKFLSFGGAANKVAAAVNNIQPLLKELCDQVNESVNVAIISGNYTVNIAIVYCNQQLRVVPQETLQVPLYCTGIGKLFLSARSDGEIDEYLDSQKLIPFTTKTITDKNKLKRQIKRIRREDVAYDDQEQMYGVRNVAVPIRDHNGDMTAALGIIGPTIRLSKERMKQLSSIMQGYAQKISEVIGGR